MFARSLSQQIRGSPTFVLLSSLSSHYRHQTYNITLLADTRGCTAAHPRNIDILGPGCILELAHRAPVLVILCVTQQEDAVLPPMVLPSGLDAIPRVNWSLVWTWICVEYSTAGSSISYPVPGSVCCYLGNSQCYAHLPLDSGTTTSNSALPLPQTPAMSHVYPLYD